MKQRIFFRAVITIIALFYVSTSFAQSSDSTTVESAKKKKNKKKDSAVSTEVLPTEIMPEFTYNNKSGDTEFVKYLNSHLQYPKDARAKGIEGTVYAQFIIEKDGQINEVTIVKGIDPECDAEVIRVLKESGQYWKPALKDSIPVRVMFTAPVKFKARP